MQADYIKAAVPDVVTVLGQKLKPFCLSHHNRLSRLNCAFVTGGIPTIPDLLLGVTVCAQTHEECEAFFDGPWEAAIEKWGKSLTGGSRLRGIFRGPIQIDWAEKAGLFAKYVQDGSRQPVVYFPAGGSESTAPWQEVLISRLWKINPMLTESQILNMPLALAWQRVFSASAAAGDLTFQTQDDLDLMAMNEASRKAQNGV
jgi:hypothetical protein